MDWSWIGVAVYSAMDFAVVLAVEHSDKVLSVDRMKLVMSTAPPISPARASTMNQGRSRSVCFALLWFMIDFVFRIFLRLARDCYTRVDGIGWESGEIMLRKKSMNVKHVGLHHCTFEWWIIVVLLSNLIVSLINKSLPVSIQILLH